MALDHSVINTTRTVQLWGGSFSNDDNLSITVRYDGQQVFSGPITRLYAMQLMTSPDSMNPTICLASWPITQLKTGLVPISITVDSGSVGGGITFVELRMNFINKCFTPTYLSNGVNVTEEFMQAKEDRMASPIAEPYNPNNRAEQDLYAMPQYENTKGMFMTDMWGDDGKRNPTLDGEDMSWWFPGPGVRTKSSNRSEYQGVLIGSWHYPIPVGSTFTCDYVIDESKFYTNEAALAYADSIKIYKGPLTWGERFPHLAGPPDELKPQ